MSRYYSSDDDTDDDYEPESFVETKKAIKYQILSEIEAHEVLNEKIETASSVLFVSKTLARNILASFRYELEDLLDYYYGNGMEATLKKAQLSHLDAERTETSEMKQSTGTCLVCCCEDEPLEALQCGHFGCGQCWQSYTRTKVVNDRCSRVITCFAYDCHLFVEDADVKRLLADTKACHVYDELLISTFVELYSMARQCPSTGCDRIILKDELEFELIVCQCGNRTCAACDIEWHFPLECHLLARWQSKLDEEDANMTWILMNTKRCPRCATVIEKNGGCNHMTCQSKTCGYHFCWVCMGDWTKHGSSYFECSFMGVEANDRDTSDAQKTERERARYFFYYTRYRNQIDSLALLESFNKMKVQPEIRVQLVFSEAVNTLEQCRQTIKYTFVFAYYLRDNNQSEIFEMNQTAFAMEIENLNELLERKLTPGNFASLKTDIIRRTYLCENYRNNLLKHLSEGYEQGWWKFT